MPAINKFIGKLDIDGAQGGWSEVYICKGTTVTTAKDNMTALITARQAMLYSGLTMIYANISDLGVNRDSYLALDGIQNGSMTVTTAKVNRDADAFLLRQETGDGKVANRYMHGVPDSCIVEGVYDATGAGGSYETALAAWITALKTNTCYLSKVNKNDPSTWLLIDWANVYRRGITSRKVGRPFGALRGRRPVA